MRILLANDDGVYSPGLLALANCASKFGEIRIFAPDVEQSSMGHAITHSRPLTQAAILGCRGVALSTPTGGAEPDFNLLEPYVERVLELVLSDSDLQLVNVNLPRQPTGLCWTSLSIRHYDGKVIPGEDPMGRKHYWLTVHPVEELEEGTDRWAIRHGLVSLTPLELDLTDHECLARARQRHPLS